MGDGQDALDQLCINTIRMLTVDAVQKANSGHPGMPMGAAPMAYALWTRFLRHNPANPKWPNRDRFVLSAGHGSMLIYSLLPFNSFIGTIGFFFWDDYHVFFLLYAAVLVMIALNSIPPKPPGLFGKIIRKHSTTAVY